MIYFIIPFILFLLLIGFFIATYYVYRYIFYNKAKKVPRVKDDKAKEQYNKLLPAITCKVEEFKAMEYEEVAITSHDGLTLRGKFFASPASDTAVIIFHGYRSNVDSEGSIITKYCLDRGFNVLAVHQRAHGQSEGHTISFGINERFDCKRWVDYIVKRLGTNTKIMLYGVSMGASTVMMASDLHIPNVKGILADCGFSSPREIIRVVIERLGYPVEIAYAVARIGAKIYGRFDIEKTSAEKALANSNIPITIIHSDGDKYVPCYMAKKCYDAANAEKKQLIIIPEAGHAFSYYFDMETYELAVEEMLETVKNS